LDIVVGGQLLEAWDERSAGVASLQDGERGVEVEMGQLTPVGISKGVELRLDPYRVDDHQ